MWGTRQYSEFPLPGGSVVSQNGGATGVQLADWLGTIRTFYSYTGGNESFSSAHAPFGESYAYAGGYPLGFAGQGGLGPGQGGDGNMTNTTYWFPERQYRSSQGRFLSPDPAGLSAANPTNPQSWNRYAYVLNNPLGSVDPLGLDCVRDNGDGTATVFGEATMDTCAGDNGFYFDGTVSQAAVDVNGNVVAVVNNQLQCSGDSDCSIYQNLTSLTVTAGSEPLDTINATIPSTTAANTATISAYHGSVGQCLGEAAIDAGLDLTSISVLPGASQDNWQWQSAGWNSGFVYTGAGEVIAPSVGVDAVEKTADLVEKNPAAQGAIRQFLRSQGVKWSVKHVSKDAALIGKVAASINTAVAAKSAYERYTKCRGD